MTLGSGLALAMTIFVLSAHGRTWVDGVMFAVTIGVLFACEAMRQTRASR